MLLNRITNRLLGEVRLRVTAPFPERVLNLCGVRKLPLWDVRWRSATEFTCAMTRRDFRALRRASEALGCTLSVERTAGAPFFWGRLRRRQALLGGLLAVGAALFFGSFFIWDFQVEGSETVTEERILRALQKNGVGLGAFGFSLDAEDLRNRVLLELPELSWITVNVSGCQAQVQVRERLPAPEIHARMEPANLVARRDGLVLAVEALEGKKLVAPGMTVTRGQLLVSGVQDVEPFGARLLSGMGTVTARTWYTLRCDCPLTVEKKVYAPRTRTKLSLIFGARRVKFFSNGSIAGGQCDKIRTRTRLTLLGLSLPVTVERETLRFYRTVPETLEPAAVKRAAEETLTAYLRAQLGEDATLRSTLCTAKQRSGVLTVTLTAECVEQIAVRVPIPTEG